MLGGILAAMPGAVAQGLLWGVMALGVYVTFKVLDYADLTVDSSICTGGAVSAVLILKGMNPLLTLVFSILAGMATGAITGFLHTKLKIPPILSGILTQLGLYSVNMRIMGKSNLSLNSNKLSQPTVISLGNVNQSILISVVFVAAVIGVLYWFFGTELGSAVRATGNNSHMVRALGVNTNSMIILGLILSNGLVGLAGGLLAQFQGYADINMGRGAIVIGLASVIIGEVIFGVRFNFAYQLGSIVCGAIIYYIIIAVVLQCGLQTTDLKLFSAVIVALALSLPLFKNKMLKHKKAVVAEKE
ncbi:MAG: ABC transporter permease [Oscillospiraceae bacterium]|nr:ABC transporter permease [Oscillospiraceae bacterium]